MCSKSHQVRAKVEAQEEESSRLQGEMDEARIKMEVMKKTSLRFNLCENSSVFSFFFQQASLAMQASAVANGMGYGENGSSRRRRGSQGSSVSGSSVSSSEMGEVEEKLFIIMK